MQNDSSKVFMASLFAMSIAEIPFLTPREKIRFLETVDENDKLESYKLIDVEKLINRQTKSSVWTPSIWEKNAEQKIEMLYKRGISTVSFCDRMYPAILRETARPPYLLYVRGQVPNALRPALAIVGTRYPTGRGSNVAFEFGLEASLKSFDVISGLARGIDGSAHRGALEAFKESENKDSCGKTFAILGSGIDTIYPSSNKEIAEKILYSGGGIISEYEIGVHPTRWTFPERNRIIAGLSRSTLVVEAPGHSGSLITASYALEEGRDVYVASKCLNGVRSSGCDALCNDGSKAVMCFQDILNDWNV